MTKYPWTIQPKDRQIFLDIHTALDREAIPLLIQQLERASAALTVYRLYLQIQYKAVNIDNNLPTLLVDNVYLGSYFTPKEAADYATSYTGRECDFTTTSSVTYDDGARLYIVKEKAASEIH